MSLSERNQNAKFHEISRPGQEADIDELFDDLFKRLGALSVLRDRGDIITYDGSNVVRLPRGEEGQVLTSRGSAAYGIQWEDRATPGGGISNGGLRYWLNGRPWSVI